MSNSEKVAFNALKTKMDSYYPLSETTWNSLRAISTFKRIPKHFNLYPLAEIPTTFAFVYSGLFRAYTLNEKGHEYNKIFFDEGMFPGAMTALLTTTPSQTAIESLEESQIILIDFQAFRQLLLKQNDLKLYQINYLEKNWLLAKDSREIQIVQENAAQRYKRFVETHPTMIGRIPQYHIALHLGITPTQLSRIRKIL